MKLDRAMPWIVVSITALIVVGLVALTIKVNSQRRAEWYAYANEHGCERVATKKGDINVTFQPIPISNSNVTMVPTVDVEDDVHAWRCRDGSIHLKRWR
jgi:hypothetical protein